MLFLCSNILGTAADLRGGGAESHVPNVSCTDKTYKKGWVGEYWEMDLHAKMGTEEHGQGVPSGLRKEQQQ